jgi:hypothetical protein
MLDRILTAPQKDLHIRRIMDQGQVLLVNLAKGHIGEDSSSLLGGLLVTTIWLAAFSRADTPPAERRDFFVYIDEFQSFTTLALANSSANAGSSWITRIVSAFVIRTITHSVIAETVARRSGCPVKHPSPKKSPVPRSATTASFPCSERTVCLTLPL